jgi:hypothetical protein
MKARIGFSVALGYVLCSGLSNLVTVVNPGEVPTPRVEPMPPTGIELNVGNKLIFDAEPPSPSRLTIDDEKGGDICYYYGGRLQWCMPKHPEDDTL